jgi:hypothetical protein
MKRPRSPEAQSPKPQKAQPSFHLRPEWIRPGDVPQVFGISRSKLYEWLDLYPGKLKTKAIGDRGSKRPIRLVSYDHLAKFIENLPDVSKERKLAA